MSLEIGKPLLCILFYGSENGYDMSSVDLHLLLENRDAYLAPGACARQLLSLLCDVTNRVCSLTDIKLTELNIFKYSLKAK